MKKLFCFCFGSDKPTVKPFSEGNKTGKYVNRKTKIIRENVNDDAKRSSQT